METKLTPQQQLFIKVYTTKGMPTFSNATLSYAEAYQYDLPTDADNKILLTSSEYKTCNANGSRLLVNDSIRIGIRDALLELFNEKELDARLNEIALNGKDGDSIQAIKIANDLKQRITKRLDITTQGRPLSNLTDAELHDLVS